MPPIGAVFYLEAGWPQWKPLDIPGTHRPLQQGSGNLNTDTEWVQMFLSFESNKNGLIIFDL